MAAMELLVVTKQRSSKGCTSLPWETNLLIGNAKREKECVCVWARA